MQRQGVWECSATWLSDQGRFMSSQVKEELRTLRTSSALGIHAALHPLAEFAIAFSSKAKLTSVPPAFPAELERKAGLLQTKTRFWRKHIFQETSDVNLMEKMKMFQGLQYKTENYLILTRLFMILWVYKKPQRCL